MSAELYPASTGIATTVTTSGSLWPVGGSGIEVDLRQEFHELLFGSATEIPKGRLGILRRARKDDDGEVIRCPCVSELTGEPDKDHFCPNCSSGGYIYDEEWIVYYKRLVSSNEGLVRKNTQIKPGIINIPFAFFYVEYSVAPEPFDRIIEVKRDADGLVVVPIERIGQYKAATVEDFRSDNGRIEYYRIAVTQEPITAAWAQ